MVYKIEQDRSSDRYLTYDQINIVNAFQKLWLSLSSWLGIYIKAFIYETRNLNSVTNLLYEIPSKFYTTFNIFYGTENAQKLMNLLFDFVKNAMSVTEALKYGDYVLSSKRIIEWYQVADEISTFLSGLNVFWDENQWRYLLYQYIKAQIDEINAIINDNFEKENEASSRIIDDIYLIAEYMAKGIISSNLQQPINQ